MLKVYCDGGSRGNPGKAAYGFLIKREQEKLHAEAGYLGIATNNYAEYTALIKALDWLESNVPEEEAQVFMDSQLVVNQVNGIYKVKNAAIRELFLNVKLLESSIKKITYHHIPRSQNKEADFLVNMALDKEVNNEI